MRKPTLLALLSVALILVCFAMPSFAQAATAGAAQAPAAAVQATPTAPQSAIAAEGSAFARVLAGTSACSSSSTIVAAAISPLPSPSLICPHCPPGWSYCNPFCRCCKGGGA